MYECTKERFIEDVKDHEMIIQKNDGLFRHITFKKPETSNLYFNLTTWPGHLCISGDMGTYVFSRLTDMFEFFRSPDGKINTQYWHEKLISTCKRCGDENFSKDILRENVTDFFRRACIDDEIPIKKRKEVWSDLQSVINSENEYETHKLAYEFESNGFELTDFWENDLKEYTYNFIWCLRAIVWGISEFDERGL